MGPCGKTMGKINEFTFTYTRTIWENRKILIWRGELDPGQGRPPRPQLRVWILGREVTYSDFYLKKTMFAIVWRRDWQSGNGQSSAAGVGGQKRLAGRGKGLQWKKVHGVRKYSGN